MADAEAPHPLAWLAAEPPRLRHSQHNADRTYLPRFSRRLTLNRSDLVDKSANRTRWLWEISPRTLPGFLLRLPLRVLPKNRVVKVQSGLNRGLRWVVGSSVHGCWLGHYEHDKQKAFRRFVSTGMHVFDVGANAGFYTLASARLVGPSGYVWAFEPCAENAHNLLRHVQLNALGNVRVVQAAVASRAGISGFSVAPSNSMGRISDTADYLVPSLAIDDFRVQRTVPVPDVMKIDVEGAENHVLLGARHRLS